MCSSTSSRANIRSFVLKCMHALVSYIPKSFAFQISRLRRRGIDRVSAPGGKNDIWGRSLLKWT